MSWGLKSHPPTSRAWPPISHSFLERLEDVSPRLTLLCTPHLWGHSVAREESAAAEDQYRHSVCFSALTVISASAVNIRGPIILKDQVLLSPSRGYSGVPGSHGWFDLALAKSAVTCWLSGFFWVILDFLNQRPTRSLDQASSWPVTSPVYIRL